MTVIDVAAILGALAWLPQIISWIYKWRQKPEIKVFHDNEAQIGFIKFGNALNIRLSFLARKKHALIDKIDLVITDKNGAHHNFEWRWYSETFYEVQSSTGNSIMAKQQNAIAINAYKNALIEKFVGFHSREFLEQRKKLDYELTCFVENQKKVGEVDPDVVKRSNEYNNLVRLYENSIIWKAGKYSASCKIHIADTNETIEHNFSFSLSDTDIDSLKKNLGLAEWCISVEHIAKTLAPGEWNWVNANVD